MVNLENDCAELRKFFDAQKEWLVVSDAKTFALQNSEIEISAERGKLILSFLSDAGFQMRRVADWKYEKQKLIFETAGNFGKDAGKIEFIPRLSAENLSDSVELARLEKAQMIADSAVKFQAGLKLVRVSLNKENGRLAEIIFEISGGKQIAAITDVTDTISPEILISAAILKIEKLRIRRKEPIENIRIIADKKTARKLQKIHALLIPARRKEISVFEISTADDFSQMPELKEIGEIDLQSLWRGKAKKDETVFAEKQISESARRITEISSAEIDVVFAKHGETLRFNGLSFARLRKIFDKEKVWFGTESNLRLLHAGNYAEFAKLIEELKIYRRFGAPNKRHSFYLSAPEAWLESVLRRNIKLLDANLILSPVHHQFRAERGKIDLLALRRDGRLVIVELKTSPDRETVLQAADYWRKIEKERRLGNLERARIFGDTKIADASPLVYLVAPMLAHHRDTDFFLKQIIPEIEFCKFDLNEDWRRNLKVIKRDCF